MRAARIALAAIALWSLAGAAFSSDVDVVGISADKAIVTVDGAGPHVLHAGETWMDIRLVEIRGDSATFIINGQRQVLSLGLYRGTSPDTGRSHATISSDDRGHFMTMGYVNGKPVTFLVDTGATLIVMSAADAHRIGLRYENSPVQVANTANGPVQFHRVKLDTVKVGEVVLNNVEAGIQDAGIVGPALLGMSFLSRMDISHEGQNMVLTKRY